MYNSLCFVFPHKRCLLKYQYLSNYLKLLCVNKFMNVHYENIVYFLLIHHLLILKNLYRFAYIITKKDMVFLDSNSQQLTKY